MAFDDNDIAIPGRGVARRGTPVLWTGTTGRFESFRRWWGTPGIKVSLTYEKMVKLALFSFLSIFRLEHNPTIRLNAPVYLAHRKI